MKKLVLFITILFASLIAYAQQSDFIVLKKKNNRTIKTFYPGAFIAGQTYNGFRISGFVTDIRHDSIFIRQEETRMVGTAFGYTLDTIRFTIAVDFRDIATFDHAGKYRWGGRKKGFAVLAVPKILMIAGVGYIVLETVNSLYRKESFSESGKLTTLGIAAGVVVAAFLFDHFHSRNDRAGAKYKVVYVKGADIKL